MDDQKHYYFLIGILAFLVAILFTFSVLVGTTGSGLSDIFTTIGQHDSEISSLIIREIRLPRAILGLLIGATLGLAGATLQGYLRKQQL